MDVSFITRHHKLSLTISILVALIFCSFAPFVQTVNNVDYFRLKDHPDQKFYESFQEIFGNDEFFVIAFQKEDIFTQQNLALLKNITSDLESTDLARDIASLANVDNIIGGEDYFKVEPFLYSLPETKEELEFLRSQAVGNPLYADNFVSTDSTTAAIVVFAYDRPDDPDYRQRLLWATRNILKNYEDDVDFYLAGWTVTNYELSQYMQRDLARFIPLTYLLIALVTFLFFRNIRLTLLAVLTISACVGSTMGLSRILGIPINNVTVIIPPLVMALTLTAIVHIFTHMQRSVLDSLPDRFQALAHVLNSVVLPCALTTLTTATGFLSLSVSELEPIREFAVLAASGMIFGFFYSFFLLPPLMLFFEPNKLYSSIHEEQKLSKVLHKIVTGVNRHKGKIVSVNIFLVAAALFFAAQIKAETNLVEFFKPKSPERQAIDFVEKNLSGVGILDISVKASARDAFKEPHNLETLQRLEMFILEQPGVDKVTSFNHFIKDMHMSFHNEDPAYYRIPDNRQLISQYLLLYDSNDIDDFINSDFDHARLTVRLGVHSSRDQARIIENIRQHMSLLDNPDLSFRVTGQSVQDVNTIAALVSGQIYSLSIALVVISLIMFMVFKSLSLGFLSLIPNCFPILLNFGLMGFMGIPLNTATALIAAVAIGIAVDDTIHFLSHYNGERKKGHAVGRAMETTVMIKGRALMSSSAILCVGFGILVLSSFMPVVYFGLLSALIMITAMIGDLIVLPAILMIGRNDEKGDEEITCQEA